jgi:hypothetical protein
VTGRGLTRSRLVHSSIAWRIYAELVVKNGNLKEDLQSSLVSSQKCFGSEVFFNPHFDGGLAVRIIERSFDGISIIWHIAIA